MRPLFFPGIQFSLGILYIIRSAHYKTSSKAYETYHLNVQQSLGKKLEATKRKSVEYMYTDGGVTGQADAVTFELMKEAMLAFFSNENGDLKCKITDGNCVQKQSGSFIPINLTHILSIFTIRDVGSS